jgi:hypothetical protein
LDEGVGGFRRRGDWHRDRMARCGAGVNTRHGLGGPRWDFAQDAPGRFGGCVDTSRGVTTRPRARQSVGNGQFGGLVIGVGGIGQWGWVWWTGGGLEEDWRRAGIVTTATFRPILFQDGQIDSVMGKWGMNDTHEKNPAAVELGRRGGAVGGRSRSSAKIRAARRNGRRPCAPGRHRGRPVKCVAAAGNDVTTATDAALHN